MRKPNGYWTYETCYEAAKKCSSYSEFARLYPGAVDKAGENKWIKDYIWFTRPVAYNKKWTKETCEAEARKYKTIKDFRKLSASAYGIALTNKWINDYVWLKRSYVERGHWQVYENVFNEALKYKTRTEFARGNSSAYNSSKENNWLDKFTWLIDARFDIYKDKIDSVYVYEFIDQKTAYVGRTLIRTQKQRDYQHIFGNDSVSKFAKSNNIAVPEMKILETDLTLKEGTEKEAFYIDKYSSEGWNMLNKAKAGAIGSLGRNYYSYNKCYEEALKYKKYDDFVKKSRAYYRASYRNGWTTDYFWLEKVNDKKVKKWTYELCAEESKKYTSRGEFNKKSNGAYSAALKNNWLDKFTWLIPQCHPSGYWTKKTCAEESKKYKTLTEWRENNQTSYNKARDNDWIKEYTWFDKNNNKDD